MSETEELICAGVKCITINDASFSRVRAYFDIPNE